VVKLSDTAATGDDPRAWRAATIDEPARWCIPLSAPCSALVERTIAALRRNPVPVTEINVSAADRAPAAESLQPVRAALEAGRGFAIIDGVPMDRASRQEAQAIYWVIGQLLGAPMAQNVQGTLLYDVRDTGQDVAYGARFSVTNAESSFHTDNSFGATVLDYVGLLCLSPAKSGGLSQNVSGYAALDELSRSEPGALETLARPFHVDRRGGVQPGESPTVRFPVITRDGPELLVRYLRYWIEAGHQKANEPLTEAQVHALDALDQVLARPELRVEFALQPGQMFFINNRWILHNRTAFEDDPTPERQRHYVRLWIQSRETHQRDATRPADPPDPARPIN
jgi:alpha-ketoglutarate-dependent taurine dioxygenase